MAPQVQDHLDIGWLFDELAVTHDDYHITDVNSGSEIQLTDDLNAVGCKKPIIGLRLGVPRRNRENKPRYVTSTMAFAADWPDLKRSLITGLRKCLKMPSLVQ